jgi:ATP-binding protein involved in chromosome partitioning
MMSKRDGLIAHRARDALRAVIDPEREQDVVSLGMIQGLTVEEGRVRFALEVSPQEGARREPLRAACEAAIAKLPGVRSVAGVLTAHSDRPAPAGQARGPSHGHAHPHAHPHAHGPAQPAKAVLPGVRTVVAVASGKGGVGKSTVAANLAVGLGRLGRKAGLLDADIYGPSVPRMLGLTGRPQTKDGRTIIPMPAHGIQCMSIGFMIEEDRPIIWRGPMVMGALGQLLTDVEWGELDVLVVDMPPGTGDAQLTLAQKVPLTGAVIVSTPQDIALIDARRGLAMFRQTHVPVFGIVENMSTYICPECGHEAHIFGHGGARETAAELGCDFLGEVPLDLAIRETSDAGLPIVATHPDSVQAQALMQVATRVAAQLDHAAGAAGRAPPRIVVQ